MLRTAALAAAVSLLAGAAFADDTAKDAPAPTVVEPQAVKAAPGSMEVGDPNRTICKTIAETGSRLGGRKVCKSARDWTQIKTDAREATERRHRMGWKTE